jgi:negative regulator of flagellin synthesis FlgM
MEIRSNLEGLSSLLGTNATDAVAERAKSHASAAAPSALGTDHATLSSAASEMAQSAGQDGVRMENVMAIQAALNDGTYSVPASAVAAKVVDSMLGGK